MYFIFNIFFPFSGGRCTGATYLYFWEPPQKLPAGRRPHRFLQHVHQTFVLFPNIDNSLKYWIENGYLPDPNNPISILVLYDNGTLGEVELQKTNANVTYETNYITIASTNNTKVNAVYFAVDFTNYKKLHIKAKGFGSGTQWSCGYSQSTPVEGITESVERQNIGTSENIITFDISLLKGTYYPFVTGYKNSSGQEQPCYLYEMWLEP